MTLQEAIGLFHAYRDAKPYIQFQTFVESLGRDNNKALVESISRGVSVIIEGAFVRQYDSSMRKYLKTPSAQEVAALLAAGKKNELTNYIYGALIMEADSKYPNPEQSDKAEEYYTRMLTYFADHKDLMDKYNPEYSLSTFVTNFIAKPVMSMFKNKLKVEQTETDAHVDAKVAYNKKNQDKIKPDGSNKWGKIIDNSATDGTIIVKWTGVKGPAGSWTVKPYNEKVNLNELDVYDLTEGARFQSENTALDSAEGKDGGLKETLKDTSHFTDTSYDKEAERTGLKEAIQTAAEEIAIQMAEDAGISDEGVTAYINKIIGYIRDRMKILEIKDTKNTLLWRKTRIEQNLAKTTGTKSEDLQAELANIEAERSGLPSVPEMNKKEKELVSKYKFSDTDGDEIWSNFKQYAKEEPEIIKFLTSFKSKKEEVKKRKDTTPRVRRTNEQIAAEKAARESAVPA